ncbi:hypothetical protein MCOR07_004020 [Pyricularia oryzae]|uniref:JmjC domain-containing protein n=1 Tax=Pyricularia grisea TaxID=148305 RepID=A0ABQ8N6L3_PYRGI|nr:hypothetical protein MCOR26_003966 [Pyricularia oryzae]KAI6291791.1 hypothetical protein MCOR33_010337 [Pyricularia grisea]KAI6322798.1 hypothetical protein MCOR30_007550 [Pyricularia oryzae]KAI6328530.1 hypothetical protein MCOR29_002668 [Pyricularia oryzae]KAI6350456.1 hypothetical protein MCOR28_000014 [Pyricularia oryzae]
MPSAMHPQAKFDPIPPDLHLESLVENTPNFNWVVRIPASKINRFGPQGFEKLVLLHVIHGGKPLVIEGWNDRLDPSLFSARWLESAYDKKEEPVRDIGGQTDMRMTIGHYLRSMPQLTNQWTPSNFREERRQRLYLKDIDCPPEWHDRLRKILPPNVFYMNDNIDKRGNEIDMDSFGETGCAPAGDLMSCLPEEMRAQNLMCYIGHEGTYTPAHREMCGSLGQNIMIEASGGDNGEKPGSSIWFMTETKDREVVKEYFLSMLGHDIEIEKHFAQVNAWKKASFPVYVVEQKPGDFLLIPPLAPHQVWNRGTRTMKVAWNRTTVETLELAIHEALPKARLVCRDEQYKNKAIIYYALKKYYKDIQSMDDNADIGMLGYGHDLVKNSTRSKQMMQDFKKLFALYTDILVDEMFGTKEANVEYIEFDSNITCSYCRCNIFNRFLTCKHCIRMLTTGDEDTYDICMECYAMGRSCVCVSKLSWCEQWNWSDLVQNYEEWRTMIIQDDGFIDINNSPLPLEIMRKKAGRKSVAQICQEQLRRRPFNDITKVEQPETLEPSDVEIDGEGRPVKKKKNRRKKKAGETYRCHVCCHRDNTFRLAFCSNIGCAEAYCYGTLYRAFDLMPQDVLRTENWKCPKCLKICNCGSCRKANNTTPYTPKKTLLGHDTKRVADDRSKELLVDFRVHNLTWLKATGEESRSHNSKRLQRLKEQADAEKAKDDTTNDVDVSMSGTGDNVAQEQQQPVQVGYGDQSAILDTDNYGQPEMAQDGTSGDPIDAHGEPDDMFVTGAAVDSTPYPDPLGDRDRMVGLGYYEQDGPDRILFDDFEAPDLNALEQEEENEYLQKMLQKAKRKAKKDDDDDPDFRGPKSWRKKSRNDTMATALYNAMVDPSLLSAGGDTQIAPAGDVALEDGVEVHPSTNAPIPGEPNQPILRHAKPMVSYVEPDEGFEEFNEVYEAAPKRDFPSQVDFTRDHTTGADPLDLAAEAMRTLLGGSDGDGFMGDALDPSQKTAPIAARAEPSRPRGRPGRPKRQSERLRLADAVPEPTAPKPRKSRTSTFASQGLDRAADDDDAQPAEQPDAGDIQQRPAPGPRKRGRPRKIRPIEDAASRSPSPDTPKYMSMAERMALRGKKLKVAKSRQAINRPSTKPSQSEASTPSTQHANTPTPVEFESAARPVTRGSVGWPKRTQEHEEREHIGHSSSVAEEQQREQEQEQDSNKQSEDDDFVLAAEEPESRPSTSVSVSSSSVSAFAPRPGPPGSQLRYPQPASVPKANPGPTVVRLGDLDLDQDDSDDFMDGLDDNISLSDSGSDDDDEGIPAYVKPKPVATRGRGRPRGGRAIRGGRGRGRGLR